MESKKLLIALLMFCFLTVKQNLFASHVMGEMITYEYVAPNQYLVTFKLYRDCFGISAPTQATVCYQSISTGLSGSVVLNLIPGSGNEIPPYPCFTGGVSTCQGGTSFGVQEWAYNGIVTLPQAAIDWIFSYEECCRNAAIINLTGAAGYGCYVYTKLDNLNYPVNSSPQLSTSSYPQFCINTLSDYNLPFIDIDGDSLVYSLVPAEDGVCGGSPISLAYNVPYSATNPLSSSTPVLFDPSTGTMTFTPNFIQTGVVCLLVMEFRNGIQIGEVKRDEMAYVTNGVINPNWMKGKVYLDQNGNNIYDTGEPGKQGTILEVQPGTFYASTNSLGDYSIPLSTGNYTTTIPNLPLYYMSTPPFNSATFTGTFQTDSMNDFALTIIPNLQNLKVTLTGNNAVPGNSAHMSLTYKNEGSTTMSGSVNLVYDSDLIYTSSTQPPNNISGDTLTWIFSNLLPLAIENIYVTFSLPASVPLNTPLNSYAEILPVTGDTFPTDNFDGLDRLAVLSCDPNEKKVEPTGPVTTTQVANGEFLEYTIFFQNTGTAPAINVVITDTIDQNFNIPNFEVLSASHSYTWNISGQGIIEFRFDNIMLPDSGTNQLLSHGFIKYRIKPKNNLIAGDKMTNTAYIVFDSNAPVITNTTSTTVISPTLINEYSEDISEILIYPNPSHNDLNIEMKLKELSVVKIEIINLLGASMQNVNCGLQSGSFKKQISLNNFSKGIYFLKVTTNKGLSVVKIFAD